MHLIKSSLWVHTCKPELLHQEEYEDHEQHNGKQLLAKLGLAASWKITSIREQKVYKVYEEKGSQG